MDAVRYCETAIEAVDARLYTFQLDGEYFHFLALPDGSIKTWKEGVNFDSEWLLWIDEYPQYVVRALLATLNRMYRDGYENALGLLYDALVALGLQDSADEE